MGESYRSIIGQELPERKARTDFFHRVWKAKRVSSGSWELFCISLVG